MPTTTLLIDFGSFHFRNYAANMRLTSHGEPTGGLYGCLKQLTVMMRNFKPSKVIVCLDSPPYLRKQMYSAYKQKRGTTDSLDYQRLQESKKITLEAFNLYGADIWQVAGMEADDLVAKYTKTVAVDQTSRPSLARDRIVMASSDSDLFQALYTDEVFLLRGIRGKSSDTLYGRSEFLEEYPGMTPENWPFLLCLAGTHNGFPGVKGIGPKTALKILLSDPKHPWKPEYDQIIDETYKLISLPHASCPPPPDRLQLYLGTEGKKSFGISDYCSDYNMHWSEEMQNEWYLLTKRQYLIQNPGVEVN